MATTSRAAEARGLARQAPRRPASHPGQGHLRRRREDRRHAVRRVQAQRRRARPHPVDRHQAPPRRWKAWRRCSPASRLPSSSAPMPIGTPFPSPEHRVVATDVVRFAGEPVAVVVATDRYVARDAVDAITVQYDVLPAVVDPEAALERQADRHPREVRQQRRHRADPRRHGRRARRQVGGRQRHRQGVQERRDRHLAAHDEPAPGAERDGAARRRRALRGGQGHDDHLVVHPEPAHPAHVHRDDERHGRERGAGDRPGGRRRLRRQDQHLRRGVRRRRPVEAPRAAAQVDRGPVRGLRRHDPRPRHPRLHRSGGQARRHGARAEDAAHRRHRRLQHAAHGGHPDADDADGQRHLRHSRPSASRSPRSSPTRRPPTPIAAPAAPRPPTSSSARWTCWRAS